MATDRATPADQGEDHAQRAPSARPAPATRPLIDTNDSACDADALDSDGAGAPPFVVEPPLWQSPELADGALAPSASLSASTRGVATLVLDGTTILSPVSLREDTLSAVATDLGERTPSLARALPVMAPAVEMPVVLCSSASPTWQANSAADSLLAYERVEIPAQPAPALAMAPVIVPVVSPPSERPPAATLAPVVVPLLTVAEPRSVPVLSRVRLDPDTPRIVPVHSPRRS